MLLTPRQREILILLARGLCVKQVATTCGISANTVRVTLDNVRARLHSGRQAHIIITALKLGEIKLEDI